MPEYPDITIYMEALTSRIVGKTLDRVRIVSPFLLRTVEPPLSSVEGRSVTGISRIGKQIVWKLDANDGGEDPIFLVFHLMIAGRFHLKELTAKPNRKITLAAFDFPSLSLHLTEAGTKKRASLRIQRGVGALAALDRGGIDVLKASWEEFRAAIQKENHTLKRILTDPRLMSGIGNSYSDEILHRARLSPLQLSRNLSDEEISRLRESALTTLSEWTELLRRETGEAFPEKVTAFRPQMAVHGKYGKSCPVCGTAVQRIVYAENECNYCPRCQTGGRLLADRSLSRLLRDDWPATIQELEEARIPTESASSS